MRKLLINNRFLLIGTGTLGAVNAISLLHNLFSYLIVTAFFLLVPGYLLACKIGLRKLSFWESACFCLGLSLLLIILSGLGLNAVHGLGLERPLTTGNIFITLDLLTLILIFLSRAMVRPSLPVFKKPSREMLLVCAILTVLPVLAAFGAIRLNNGASNILTMLLFLLIAIIFVVLVCRKGLSPVYPYAIITIGLSVLFSTSLRGWSITGHDIQREFYVFQLTSKTGYWNIHSLRDPYNACLSITILPTIIEKITAIPAPYIYKVVFQAIFAIGLLPVFFFAKRLSNLRTAFIGTFLFISFPTFLNDMPFLNRQEIAFLFLGLLLLATALSISRKLKSWLTILFLIGLIVSHYSSSYVMLALLGLALIFYKLLSHKRPDLTQARSAIPLLSLPIISIAVIFTFLWNAQITVTTQGLATTLTQSIKDLIDHSAAQAGDTGYSIVSNVTESPVEKLVNYAGSNAANVNFAALPNLPPTKLGEKVSHLVSAETINNFLRNFSSKVLQILLLIGAAVMLLRKQKKANKHETYLMSLVLSCILLLILQTLLPQLSVNYGTLRFFQQVLIIIGIPIVLGAETILRLAGSLKNYALALFFALLFLDLSGFIPQVLGSYPAQLSLNNSGQYYALYYIHAGEVDAANWLVEHNAQDRAIQSDGYAAYRFLQVNNYGLLKLRPLLGLQPDAYVYEDYANVRTQIFEVSSGGDQIPYTLTFNIGDTRNLTYINGNSKIFQ